MALAPLSNHLGQVGPGQNVAFAAGVDNAGQQGDHSAALFGAGALSDAPDDDPMTSSPFGFVVGQRQMGMGHNDPDRFPVIEKLARQGVGFLMSRVPMRCA